MSYQSIARYKKAQRIVTNKKKKNYRKNEQFFFIFHIRFLPFLISAIKQLTTFVPNVELSKKTSIIAIIHLSNTLLIFTKKGNLYFLRHLTNSFFFFSKRSA